VGAHPVLRRGILSDKLVTLLKRVVAAQELKHVVIDERILEHSSKLRSKALLQVPCLLLPWLIDELLSTSPKDYVMTI